jgi:hypothetical protein
MAQSDLNLANISFPAARTDINSHFLSLATLSSGASAPPDPFAYMLWADVSSGDLKQRNGSNTGWVTIGKLAQPNLGLLSNTALTGVPTCPTPLLSASDTQVVNTAYVKDQGVVTNFFYADRSASVNIPSESLSSFSTNWNVRHGVANFNSGDWTCPRTGWYEVGYGAKVSRTGGTFFSRFFGDIFGTDNSRIELWDFHPGNNVLGGLSGSVAGTKLVFMTLNVSYRLRIFVRHDALVAFESGDWSFRWAGLNGIGLNA